MRFCFAMIGALVVGGAAPIDASAQQQGAGVRLAPAVNIENKRPVALQRFEIVMARKGRAEDRIVGRLDRPLPAGASARFLLIGAKGCQFLAQWAFDDIKDAGDVDLCNDAHIILVD